MDRMPRDGDERTGVVPGDLFKNRVGHRRSSRGGVVLTAGGRFGFTALAAAALAGCSGPLSTLETAGVAAGNIALLWWIMLAGATAIFAFVMGLLAWAFRRQAGSGRDHLWRWLGLGGVAFPTVVIVVLLVYALASGERMLPHPGARDAIRIDVVARQWSWSFQTAGGEATIGEAVIPVGRAVDFHVSSEDVIHSFWVPQLGGKIDAIPGHTNVIRLVANEPGVYRGQCAEFCGVEHARMGFHIRAVPPELFDQGGEP